MRFLIALICPPLAVLLCGKPFQAILNILLAVVGFFLFVFGAYVLPLIHALCVVSAHKADKRTDRLIQAVHSSRARDVLSARSEKTIEGRVEEREPRAVSSGQRQLRIPARRA